MPKLYRDYDREELDVQYNAQATVGDITPFIREYTELSSKAYATLDCRRQIPFGPSAEETLDLFPAGGNAPLFVFIHGGYWRMLSSADSSFMAPNFVDQGVAVAAVNYTLRPHATLDQIVAEVRRSIAWLYNNCSAYDLNPERIFIGGSSAGGHLAGMLISGGWHEEFGVPNDIIKGCLVLSGLYELEPVALSYANDWLNIDKETARRNSPIYALPEKGCPLVLSYGGSETAEFKRQSEDYAAHWRSAGFETDCFERTERNHFDIPLELCVKDSILDRKVFDLINRDN